MKLLGFSLLVLLSLISPAAAQSLHEHEATTQLASADAKKAFAALKMLAGSWTGQITSTPAAPEVQGKFVQFDMRVTSRGNAMVHQFSVSGIPDHPVTMFYLDGDLTLTHYCDAGNRPRMRGTMSPDGKKLTFEFLDLSGGDENGHMHHVEITFIDANHHLEDWTYMLPGGKRVVAHFDLQRTNFEPAPAVK
jgi:hypothetical protein